MSDISIDDAKEQKKERLLLLENKDGSCVCVNVVMEERFLEIGKFYGGTWKYFSEIEEPKYREIQTIEEAETFFGKTARQNCFEYRRRGGVDTVNVSQNVIGNCLKEKI